MKIIIWYFSGTGNTWHAAEKLSKEFRLHGTEAHAYSIESLTSSKIQHQCSSCDIIGIGYPVYGSDLPLIMKEFLKNLPPPEKEVPVFLFCTQWLFSGDGTWAALEFFPDGYMVKWSEHFLMPNNVCVSIIRIPYTNDQQKIARKAGKAEKRIRKLVGNVLENRPKKRGFTQFSTMLGRMQRSPFRRWFDLLRNDIGFDSSRCIRCGTCVDVCPADNFLWMEDGSISQQGTCILCVRCYNFCPEQAVTYMGRPHKMSRGIPYHGPAGYVLPERNKNLE